MGRKVGVPIVGIALAVVIIGGGALWYYLNSDIVQPNSSLLLFGRKTLAATLAYQQDGVEVNINGAGWTTVETDMVLHEGDGIRTSATTTSRAIVMFENGDIIRLGYNSEVSLSDLRSSNVTIMQTSGASYSRVAKSQGVYQIKTDAATIKALGTAFDVVMTDEFIDVNVVESKVEIKIGAIKHEVEEGNTATIDTENQDVSVVKIDTSVLTNDWYTWNKEEDSKTTTDYGILDEYKGPSLVVNEPKDGAGIEGASVTVSGTVHDIEATLTINGEQVANNQGSFLYELSLLPGKNIITVVAESADGNKSIREIKVTSNVPISATPITLTAETESDGVRLQWNESTAIGFQYYKVVRSETNADLKYPEQGYITKLDKGLESYTDSDVNTDTQYYYRVCEVVDSEHIFCSNVLYMQGKNVEQDISDDTTETEDEPEGDNDANFVGIKLAGEATSAGIKLTWNVEGITIENGFKIVKSTEANPVFPGNDYQYLSDSSTRSYKWALTDGATYHFRACQYNGDGQCLVYSNDISVTAYQQTNEFSSDSESTAPVMSVTAETTGVGIYWTDTSENAGFKYYKVVRSEINPDLRYPDNSYIAAKSAGQESHRDYGAAKGTAYYYRICAVGDDILCSNVVQVIATHDNPAPTAVTLSGVYGSSSLALSWNASGEKDFKYYKIVWSQTDSTPTYSENSYIAVDSTAATATFTDDGSEGGVREESIDLAVSTHYYSVCVVDSRGQVACSNTVTLIDGVVQ